MAVSGRQWLWVMWARLASLDPFRQLRGWSRVEAIEQMGSDLRGEGERFRKVQTCLPPTVINKYKRRRFQKTKNLLTGETEADPEMIKVCGFRQTLEGKTQGHQAGGDHPLPEQGGSGAHFPSPHRGLRTTGQWK